MRHVQQHGLTVGDLADVVVRSARADPTDGPSDGSSAPTPGHGAGLDVDGVDAPPARRAWR